MGHALTLGRRKLLGGALPRGSTCADADVNLRCDRRDTVLVELRFVTQKKRKDTLLYYGIYASRSQALYRR
jgi:hypothetical protein